MRAVAINDAPCCCSELAGRTVLVLDSSQGIGKAIAVKAARDGANVLIAANTSATDPCKRDETIQGKHMQYCTCNGVKMHFLLFCAIVEAAGGRCLPCIVDVRDEDQVQAAVDKAVETFGGIDILINASAPAAIGNMDTPAVSSSSRLVHMRLPRYSTTQSTTWQ